MHHTVIKLGKFAGVPTVGSADEITRDTLYSLKFHSAFRAYRLILVGILITAFRAMVTVVVDRAVSDVILIHHIDDLHDSLLIMSGITVNLHIEDVSAASEVMIGSLNFGLVARRAMVIHRHMVGVGVIILVGNARYHAEHFPVNFREFSGKTLCRSCKDGIIMSVLVAIAVNLVAEEGDYLQTELLCLVRFTVMLADEGDKTLCQSDEPMPRVP